MRSSLIRLASIAVFLSSGCSSSHYLDFDAKFSEDDDKSWYVESDQSHRKAFQRIVDVDKGYYKITSEYLSPNSDKLPKKYRTKSWSGNDVDLEKLCGSGNTYDLIDENEIGFLSAKVSNKAAVASKFDELKPDAQAKDLEENTDLVFAYNFNERASNEQNYKCFVINYPVTIVENVPWKTDDISLWFLGVTRSDKVSKIGEATSVITGIANLAKDLVSGSIVFDTESVGKAKRWGEKADEHLGLLLGERTFRKGKLDYFLDQTSENGRTRVYLPIIYKEEVDEGEEEESANAGALVFTFEAYPTLYELGSKHYDASKGIPKFGAYGESLITNGNSSGLLHEIKTAYNQKKSSFSALQEFQNNHNIAAENDRQGFANICNALEDELKEKGVSQFDRAFILSQLAANYPTIANPTVGLPQVPSANAHMAADLTKEERSKVFEHTINSLNEGLLQIDKRQAFFDSSCLKNYEVLRNSMGINVASRTPLNEVQGVWTALRQEVEASKPGRSKRGLMNDRFKDLRDFFRTDPSNRGEEMLNGVFLDDKVYLEIRGSNLPNIEKQSTPLSLSDFAQQTKILNNSSANEGRMGCHSDLHGTEVVDGSSAPRADYINASGYDILAVYRDRNPTYGRGGFLKLLAKWQKPEGSEIFYISELKFGNFKISEIENMEVWKGEPKTPNCVTLMFDLKQAYQ